MILEQKDWRISPCIKKLKLRTHPVVGQGKPVKTKNIEGGINK